jgi:hypothetical protein
VGVGCKQNFTVREYQISKSEHVFAQPRRALMQRIYAGALRAKCFISNVPERKTSGSENVPEAKT